MTRLLDDRLLRADLAHGDERLFPSAAFDLGHSTVSMNVRDPAGLDFLLGLVFGPAAGPTTVSLHLKPRDHRPAESFPPEFPPSNLLFGVDAAYRVAAVALLAFDRDGRSHQWLSRGDAWHADAARLAMDPANADATPFPRDAYVTLPPLRAAVRDWAWGTVLPPAGVSWRPASEHEVGWSWF